MLSLALNLAVAGLAAGVILRQGGALPGAPPRAVALDPGFGPFAAALSPEDRRALRRAFLAERGAVLEGIRADRADRAALVAALRADPFDPAAMDAAAARLTARGQERAELGQRLIRAHVLGMTAAERADFAARLEAAFARRPGSRGDTAEPGRHHDGRDRDRAAPPPVAE
ncbi:MAG: periplasmic heavy metal sensor [Gemmobacter sp.]